MEKDFGQKEYLTANHEILSSLTDKIDDMLLNSEDVVTLQKKPKQTDAVFISGMINQEEVLDYFRTHEDSGSPTVEEIIDGVKQHNSINVATANISIAALQAWVSQMNMMFMSPEEIEKLSAEPMVSYEIAEYSDATLEDGVSVGRTILYGLHAKDIDSSIAYEVSKADDLLLTTLSVVYVDGDLARVSIDYSPKQDDEMQEWVKITGKEFSSRLLTIILMGVRESGEDFDDNILELQQQLIAKGVSDSDVLEITFGLQNRIVNIKEDIKFKGWSNASTPTIDDLINFKNYLED